MHFTPTHLAFALLLISPSLLSVSASPSLAPTTLSDVDITNPPVEEKKRSADSAAIVKPNENCPASPSIEHSGDPSTNNGCGPKSDGYRRMSRRSEVADARAHPRSWSSNQPTPITTDKDPSANEKIGKADNQGPTPTKVTKRDLGGPYITPTSDTSAAIYSDGPGGSTKDQDITAEIWRGECAEGQKDVCLKRNAKA